MCVRADKENALKESNKFVCLLTPVLVRVEAFQLSYFRKLSQKLWLHITSNVCSFSF